MFAIFPRHVDGQVVHARFDVRALDPSVVGPGSGRLGHVEGHSHPDHDVRVTTTLCLPRDQSFFLIASGNATRGSAFGRFTVTVASLEYHNLTIFSAGSEWTRGAEYDSDHPVGEGDGTFRFLEDQGVGPPLWDTPDSSRVYQLHGRARFDTWRRNPSASRPADPRSRPIAKRSSRWSWDVPRTATARARRTWDGTSTPRPGATRWRPRAGTGSRGAPTW